MDLRSPPFLRLRKDTEQEEIKTGCYELLLVLADAEAAPLPGQPPAKVRQAAETALQILDRAARLGLATRSLPARCAKFLEQAGDHRRGAKSLSERPRSSRPRPSTSFSWASSKTKRTAGGKRSVRSSTALELRPDYFWAQYFLAACHLKLDPPEPAQAKAHLTASLVRRADFPWIFALRGYAHGELKEFAAAEADFQHALSLSNDADVKYGVLVNRGAMRLHQSDPAAAIADLTEAIAIKPGQEQAHTNLALAYGSRNDWTKAIDQIDLAIRMAPRRGSLYRNRDSLLRPRRPGFGISRFRHRRPLGR